MADERWPLSLGILEARLIREQTGEECGACGALVWLDAVYEIVLNDPAATVLQIPTRATEALARRQNEEMPPSLDDLRATAWLQLMDLGNALAALTMGRRPYFASEPAITPVQHTATVPAQLDQ